MHSTMSSVTVNTNISVSDGKARKCGGCGVAGHDKRNCPTGTKVAAAPKIDTANHLRFLSRKETGPARLTDPDAYWASLGPESGTYPFERDMKGCLHLPAILKGSYTHSKEIQAMPEYTWNAERKVYLRVGPCPGCC
jgi:hypothetical protein